MTARPSNAAVRGEMFAYPKGSEWTQWDLHIHTPATLLSNAFAGVTEADKWESYCKAVAQSGLHVIAPTNYFCVDGVDKVVEALEAGRLGGVQCVLPNIEFRINQNNKDGTHIHVHVIFADRFARDLEPVRDFLGGLELFMTTPDNKVEHCSHETVARLGAKKVLVELRELDKKLTKSFTRLDDYMVVAGARGLGNFRPGKGDARGDTVAIEIDRMCDLIYGGSLDDRTHFLNGSRYQGAIKKPVLACSDAHESDTVGSRRTWIRANPTYEGLKQTVFEPDVRVSLENPSTDKTVYSSIDSLRFVSPPENPDLFPTEPVMLNSDLTAIIGGKSTGKSLFLHYLARTVDERQAISREAVVSGCDTGRYDFDKEAGFDVEVTWSDGHTQLFSTRARSDGTRKIVYIPQRFLNGICDLGAPSGGRTLDEFTRDALEQRPSLAAAFGQLSDARSECRKNVRESLDRLLDHHQHYAAAQTELSETGDEAGVLAEIARLDGEIGQLRDSSEMTDEERQQYNSLSAEMVAVAALEENLRSDRTGVADAANTAHRAVARLGTAMVDLTDSLQHPDVKAAAVEALKPFAGLADRVGQAFSAIESKADSCSTELLQRRTAAEEALKPLASSVEGQRQLETLIKKRNDEATRLSQVRTLVKKRDTHEKAVSREVAVLAQQTKNLILAHSSTCAALARESDALGDISFTARTAFDSPAFQQHFVEESVKVPTLKACLGVTGQYVFEFASDLHADYVEKATRGLVHGSVERMKGVSLQHALEALVEDRLLIDYQIEFHGDRIDAMSPGKRALVVLKILLELSDDEWPILLDQPDDDLDSRSVYRELVQYFKEKKRMRQVVLVTHNPNLVVGADADSVVVANQSGQERGRENVQSRFEYVSGGLELSFLDPDVPGVLQRQGIREHVCDILEGGTDAFRERERKYRLH